MSRRKGELTPSAVDRAYPHQIALLADDCGGATYYVVEEFCAGRSLSPRGHTFVANDRWHRVFCFRERTDAEAFQARFGGEWFDPSRRGRGSRWQLLKPPNQRYY